MNTNAKHTQLPYASDQGHKFGQLCCIEAQVQDPARDASYSDTVVIARGLTPENAEFIVRACNSHYELLAMLVQLESDFSTSLNNLQTRLKTEADFDKLIKLRSVITSAQGKEN